MVRAAVFEHLAKGGLAVYSFDAHGHGKSEPSSADGKCYIHSCQHLVRGVALLLTARLGARQQAAAVCLLASAPAAGHASQPAVTVCKG
jgi:alpha-beta hydrolase superfamily lysophospholipase